MTTYRWSVKCSNGRELGSMLASSSGIALTLARARWPGHPDLYVYNMQAAPDTTSFRDWWIERGY